MAASRAARAAQAVLEPGETVEAAADGSIKPSSTARELAKTAAVAAVTAVATLGMATAVANPRRVCVALTDRHLLILQVDGAKTYRVKVLARVPRTELRARPVRSFPSLASKSYLLCDEAGHGLSRLTFTLWQRANGQRMAEALGAPTDQGAQAAR